MFRIADSYLLPLAETVAITLGVKMLRQGDAVEQARKGDESVDHVLTTNAELMQKMRLSQAIGHTFQHLLVLNPLAVINGPYP